MKNYQDKFNSKQVINFLENWEEYEISDEFTAYKRSLTIYLKKELLGFSKITYKSKIINRFNNFFELLRHILFYFLHSIKWFLFFLRKKNKEIIVINLLSDKSISENYFKAININYPTSIIINFGIRYELSFLIGVNYYCFPFFFYRILIFFRNNNYRPILFEKLKTKLEFCKINIPINVFKNLRHSLNVKIVTEYLIDNLKRIGEIKFFIQDLEFISIGYVLTYLFKSKGVKTISIDHAISLYKNEYNYRLADLYLVWGNNERLHLIENCKVDDSRIKIIGNENKTFKLEKDQKKNKKKWLYLMQSYKNNIYFYNNRKIKQFERNLAALGDIIKNNYPDIELIVKSHPIDRFSEKNYYGLSKKELNDILPETDAVFFEDTSAALDCLFYDLFWIYIPDPDNNSIFGQIKIIPKLIKINEANISSLLNNKLQYEDKLEIYNYFYQPNSYFTMNFSNVDL